MPSCPGWGHGHSTSGSGSRRRLRRAGVMVVVVPSAIQRRGVARALQLSKLRCATTMQHLMGLACVLALLGFVAFAMFCGSAKIKG